MSELYLMVTVTDRKRLARFITFYKEQRVAVNFVTLGTGTASNETMDCLGLESSDKSVTFSVVTGQVWERLRKGLESRLRIDVPGTGIAFIVPLSSIGGRRELLFLTENQDYEKGEESTLKDTTHELLVVIANHGYSDQIMDAAREAGAAGGTVIHAKGTGMERAERFLGVSLASEKEMIFIVAKKSLKNGIMQSIMQNAGMESKAKSIVFSLPVTATAGLRLVEEDRTNHTGPPQRTPFRRRWYCFYVNQLQAGAASASPLPADGLVEVLRLLQIVCIGMALGDAAHQLEGSEGVKAPAAVFAQDMGPFGSDSPGDGFRVALAHGAAGVDEEHVLPLRQVLSGEVQH